MKANGSATAWQETETRPHQLRDEVLSAFRETPRRLPSKLLYDQRGSMLFDCLCTLPEYYPARAEAETVERHAGEIAAMLGPACTLFASGARDGRSAQAFWDCRDDGRSRMSLKEHLWHLRGSNEATSHQHLRIVFHQSRLPPDAQAQRRIVYLPWCIVGSLRPSEINQLFAAAEKLYGQNGGVLLSLDLTRDARVLEQAYNDRLGIAAAFNLNILERLNRELDCNFNLRWFQHRAFYDLRRRRTEMQVVSLRDQTVSIGGLCISLKAYETIQTARYYRNGLPGLARLAEASGLRVKRVWFHEQGRFTVQYLEKAESCTTKDGRIREIGCPPSAR